MPLFARAPGRRGAAVIVAVVAATVIAAVAASAATVQIASDPYTQATCKASTMTNHSTLVEPDSFSNASTIVAAYQVGRIYDGGACAIGFATSTNNGGTWTSGLLPGITKWDGSGHNDRATDASVAYDAKHNAWLQGKKFLLVPYHMIGAHAMESGILGGYVDFIRRTHPTAPVPGVFLAEIDPARVEAARRSVPSLQHGRRFGIADPKAGPEHLHLVRGSA